MQKSDKINSLAKNLEMILNKNNKINNDGSNNKEIIKETIIITEIQENNKNIPVTKNKKKKKFQNFEDN